MEIAEELNTEDFGSKGCLERVKDRYYFYFKRIRGETVAVDADCSVNYGRTVFSMPFYLDFMNQKFLILMKKTYFTMFCLIKMSFKCEKCTS